MISYRHILSYVARTPWAILPDKMDEILSILAFRATGGTLTAEEIAAKIGERSQPSTSRAGGLAVIPLRGVIAHRMGTMEESSGGMSAERFTQMVKQASADDSIGTILLDVDSPGGTVAGLVEAADAVFHARESKRVVAMANATMASAAYWIASQASEIVAIPSAIDRCIGSIGVFAVHQDLSAALEKEGIKVTLIKAGEHKAEGNPFEPLSDETRAQIQSSVDAAKAQFVKTVARGRGVSASDVVANFGDGRAFGAKEAKEIGLIDKIAPFDEMLGSLLGKSRGSLRAEEPSIPLPDTSAEDYLADRFRQV